MQENEHTGALAWAQETDLPAVLTLLEGNALPTKGVEAVLPPLLVAYEEQSLIGCAVLEVYGAVALLRSVAIHPAHQGRHLGPQLVLILLDHARSLCIQDVYLLTETASEYFPRFGFRPIDRSAAALAIQHSVEWTSVCPESAQTMVLHMEGG